jgi:REP element-mobilizing transposase RayT
MFKILILQSLYQLSDEQMEYQINNRYSFGEFLGLAGSANIPDDTTIWKYRELLTKQGVIKEAFFKFRAKIGTGPIFIDIGRVFGYFHIMRDTRYKIHGEAAVYHCLSRVTQGRFLLGVEEKDFLRQWLWRAAEFCGVEIITYALMSNHFHVLVRIPEKEAADAQMTDEHLAQRLGNLEGEESQQRFLRHRPAHREESFTQLGLDISDEDRASWDDEWQARRARLLQRMHDVSQFMKLVKERFTTWYNRRHQTYGTLWADRYKSLIVEDHPDALKTLALYIDLNPVRAQLVHDPKDYAWCGYAEAESGHRRVQRQLAYVVDVTRDDAAPEQQTAAWEKEGRQQYRAHLLDQATAVKLPAAGVSGESQISAKRRRQSSSPAPIPSASAEKNKTEQKTWRDAVREKVRYLTEGMALGRKAWVEKIYQSRQARFTPKRTSGAREIKGANWNGLCVIKDVRGVERS